MTRAQSARIRVYLKPGSSRAGVVAWRDGEIWLSVRARPIEGRANEALLDLLAETLDVPPTSLAIVSGMTARHKTVEVAGRTQEWLDDLILRRFGEPGSKSAG